MIVYIPEPKHDFDDEKEFLIGLNLFFSNYDLSDPSINKNILRAIDSSVRKRLTVVEKKIDNEISEAGSQAIERDFARNSFQRKVGLRSYNLK